MRFSVDKSNKASLQLRILQALRTEEPATVWQLKRFLREVSISEIEKQVWDLARSRQIARDWTTDEIYFALINHE